MERDVVTPDGHHVELDPVHRGMDQGDYRVAAKSGFKADSGGGPLDNNPNPDSGRGRLQAY
jgi:hypothetical protein